MRVEYPTSRCRPTVVRALFLALALAACGGGQHEIAQAHHRARVEASAAHQAGRYADAVEHYREACRLDPEDVEACRAGRELADWIVARALDDADAPCTAGDVAACAAALSDARRVLPDDGRVRALLDRAGDEHLARCEAGRSAAPEALLAQLSCARSAEDAIATPGYAAALAELGRAVAAELLGMARAPAVAAEPGAELVYAELAACAGGDAQSQAEHARARERLAAARGVPLALSVQAHGVNVGTGDLCARLGGGSLAGRARCADEGTPLSVRIDAAPLAYTSSTHLREASYQAGVDRNINPAYPGAERRLRGAERARRQLELEREQRRLECERAERRRQEAGYCYDCPEHTAEEDACSAADSFDELYQQRVAEEDAARNELASTPEMIETPVYASQQYQVTDHRWSVQYTITASIAGQPPQTTSQEFVFTDSSHGGAPAAGIAPDSLTEPTAVDVAHRVGDAAYNHVAHHLGAHLRHLAAERGAACRGTAEWTPAWLGCWAEARLLSGEKTSAAALVPGLRCAR